MTNTELIAEARDARHMGISGYTTSELFDMVGRLIDALEAAESRVKELETGEWEYRVRTDYGRVIAQGQFDGLLIDNSYSIERRRKAGPWLPVEGEGE